MSPQAPKPLHVVSPIITSQFLSKVFGAKVNVKLDNVQPSGSFKIRGLGHLAQQAHQQGKTALVSSSGGNAGLAASYAGRALGMDTRVIVPESTPKFVQEKIESYGSSVVVHGAAWDETDKYARELAKESHVRYVPPFDDPAIWEGNSSLITEIVENNQLTAPPAAVVVSVGGGGLLCGVVRGLQKVGWGDVPVIAMETEGAASLHESVISGSHVTLPAITSVAKSLGAKTVATEAIALSKSYPIISLKVSDKEAVKACVDFAENHLMLVEPACGASLAAVSCKQQIVERLGLSHEELDRRGLLVVVCGGSGTSMGHLAKLAQDVGLQ